MVLDAKSYAQGVVDGMRHVGTKNMAEADEIRIRSLVCAINFPMSLDAEAIREAVAEVKQWYFNMGGGPFYMAHRLKKVLEKSGQESRQDRYRIAFVRLAELMCDDLNHRAQLGRPAKQSLDLAVWLYPEIRTTPGGVAARLMRACGAQLSGTEIDQFFWSIKDDITQFDLARAFAQGMVSAERPIEILANHLISKGRGPKTVEPE